MPKRIHIGVQPKWQTVPDLTFTSGTVSSVNLASYVYNPRGYALTFTVESGSPPTGLSISGNLLQWDGRLVAASNTAITLRFTTSINTAVSNSATVAVALGADINAPSVPTGLTATAVSSSQINLSWSASTDQTVTGRATSGLAGYRLYRAGVLISTQSGLTFSDTGLTASTLYNYTVQAYDNAGNTSTSASASATTQASGGAPSITTMLTWSASPGATSYRVYRGTSPGVYSNNWNVGNVTSYNVNLLTPAMTFGTTYYFAVAAIDGGGEGVKSSPITVRNWALV